MAGLTIPDRNIIVGVAVHPSDTRYGEDILYTDSREWKEDQFTEARTIQSDLRILLPDNILTTEGRDYQFPPEAGIVAAHSSQLELDQPEGGRKKAKRKLKRKAQRRARRRNR